MLSFLNLKARQSDRKPGDDPSGSILKRFTNFRRAMVSPDQKFAAQSAMHHVVTYRCLDKIATTFQGVGWYIERDPNVPKSFRTNDTMISELISIMNSPTDELNGLQFRYWLALCYATYGRIPLKVGMSILKNQPNAIYPLDPSLCLTKYDGRGQRDYLQYGPDGDCEKIPFHNKLEKGTGGLPTQSFAMEIKRPTLSGVRGTGAITENNTPLNAIGLPANIVTELMRRAWETASGHPNTKYIVATEKTLTDPQQNNVKKKFESTKVGEEESGNVMILTNTTAQVHKLDNSLSDIHSKMPLDDMSRQICGAFGIPVAIIGFAGADGSKFANNYEESRLSFFEDTMIPGYFEPICAGLSEGACPEGYVLRYDADTVPALQERRAKRAKDVSAVNFLTLSEKRELCGYAPMKPGEEPHSPLGSTQAPTPQDPDPNATSS